MFAASRQVMSACRRVMIALRASDDFAPLGQNLLSIESDIVHIKVFEDPQETFFKKLLWWGVGQRPTFALPNNPVGRDPRGMPRWCIPCTTRLDRLTFPLLKFFGIQNLFSKKVLVGRGATPHIRSLTLAPPLSRRRRPRRSVRGGRRRCAYRCGGISRGRF